MKILIENSTWNNIGDAFYQTALYCLLKTTCPNDNIFMEEGPMRRAFRPKAKKHIDNLFNMTEYQTADLHIFSGPILSSFLEVYSKKIIDIKQRGNNFAFISVSSAGISSNVLRETGSFLEKYPPIFFSSRDPDTYLKFKEYVPNIYNGICTAFLVDKMLPVDVLNTDFPFFISSFYTELEPLYEVEGAVKIENIKLNRKSTYLNFDFKYTRHLNFLRPQQEKLGEHKIIRVHQELGTKFYHIKFSHPNSFMSFNLLSYLALYKSADFTISDRVHSCAVSLAFGKPAQLFTNSPRAGIFDRLGFNYTHSGAIMKPNLEIIDLEAEKLAKKIKEYI